MSDRALRYIVVTKDSARWFGVVLDEYAALGISPFVMLDASSGEETEALLVRRGIEYAKGSAEFPLGEALLPLIAGHVDSEWVLRLDDDELPSRALCALVEARLPGLTDDVVGFQRRWIRLRPDGRCEYSRHPLIVSRLGAIDTQWRLFRPRRVRYRSEVPHTPGFHVPPGSRVATHGCYIAHFNWLVRSAGERRSQVADYDGQAPDAGSRFRDIKVWEDGDVADHRFCVMETDEFDRVAARLAATAAFATRLRQEG